MKKTLLYSLILVALLSSCAKKKELVQPESKAQQEAGSFSILINNLLFSKTADVYASSIEQHQSGTAFNSTFQVKSEKGEQGAVSLNVYSKGQLSPGAYTLGAAGNTTSVSYLINGVNWSSLKGHQKGASFRVLDSKSVDAGSGYVSEITLQVNCFLYNDQGEFIPFSCITTAKF